MSSLSCTDRVYTSQIIMGSVLIQILSNGKDKGKLGKSCCTGGSIIPTDLQSSIPKLLILIIYKCVTNEIVICKVFFFQLSNLINQ